MMGHSKSEGSAMEVPAAPPPKKTEEKGLAARAALNSLKALGPVAQFVRWGSGMSPTPPQTPRTPRANTSSSQPALPTVDKARPPSDPAPKGNGRRPPSISRSGSQTPREESTPRERPALPSVTAASPTPTRQEGPGSASVKMSYQMTPRGEDGAVSTAESPVPQRRTAKAPHEVVSQSAPAPFSNERLGATGNVRELMEVQSHAQKLLEAVFDITITEEAAVSIFDSYPELVWLANCLRRCPLPPGWTAVDAGNNRLRYVEMESNISSEMSPLLARVADMGRLMLHWRQNPSTALDVAAALKTMCAKDKDEAQRARRVWQGPHKDPKSGAEFWHCPISGRSTWGDPGAASEFLSRVSDRLVRALPSPSSPSSSTGAEPSRETVEVPPQMLAPVTQRPETPLTVRQNEVRAMMAELLSSAKPPSSKPSPRPRPAAVKAQKSEPTLVEVGEEIRGQLSSRGKERSEALATEPSSRVKPGEGMDGTGENFLRPECRRRRPSASGAALAPLGDAEASQQENQQTAGPAAGVVATEPSGVRPGTSQGSRLAQVPPRAPGAIDADIAASNRPRTRRSLSLGEEAEATTPATPSQNLAATGAAKQATGRLNLNGIASSRPGTGRLNLNGTATGRPGTGRLNLNGTATGRPGTGRLNLNGTASSRPGTGRMNLNGTTGLGATGMIGKMCAGAIAAAMNEAFSPDNSALLDDDEDFLAEDNYEILKVCDEAPDVIDEHDAQEPTSPSMMSILVPRSPSPKRRTKAPLSPQAESPSIILMDDEGPMWTLHKPLPKPETPPRSTSKPRTPPRMAPLKLPKSDRPVLLGVPEPLSARARCSSQDPPLSARRHGPRPGNKVRYASVGGA